MAATHDLSVRFLGVRGSIASGPNGVPKLVLFHHDPSRTDAGLAAIEAHARANLSGTIAAREGMILSARDAEHAAAA